MDPAFAQVPLDDLLEGIKAGTYLPTSLALPHDFILIRAEPLLAAIEFNQSVTHLDLSCNNLGDAIGQKLGNILKNDTILRTVRLKDNTITEYGFNRFAEAIVENDTCESLDLSCNFPGEAALVRLCEALSSSRGLRDLNLAYVKLTEACAVHLAATLRCEDVRLQHLDVSFNNFGEEGCAVVANALADNIRLLSFDISGNCMRDKGAGALAEALKRNRTLEAVRARDNFIKVVGAEALGKALQENTGLALLDLSNNNIWEGGAPEFARGVGAHPALRCLAVRSSNLRMSQTGPLAAALSVEGAAPSLTELDLSVNAIEDVGIGPLCEMLRKHTPLKSLNLRFNGLKDAGAAQLAGVLALNKTLERLDLQHNGITEAGASRLADALRTNATLRHLDLARNTMREGTAELITELLQRGRSPEEDIGTPLEEAMRLLERDFGAGPHGGAQAVTA